VPIYLSTPLSLVFSPYLLFLLSIPLCLYFSIHLYMHIFYVFISSAHLFLSLYFSFYLSFSLSLSLFSPSLPLFICLSHFSSLHPHSIPFSLSLSQIYSLVFIHSDEKIHIYIQVDALHIRLCGTNLIYAHMLLI